MTIINPPPRCLPLRPVTPYSANASMMAPIASVGQCSSSPAPPSSASIRFSTGEPRNSVSVSSNRPRRVPVVVTDPAGAPPNAEWAISSEAARGQLLRPFFLADPLAADDPLDHGGNRCRATGRPERVLCQTPGRPELVLDPILGGIGELSAIRLLGAEVHLVEPSAVPERLEERQQHRKS
jgi:hypothetical protein